MLGKRFLRLSSGPPSLARKIAYALASAGFVWLGFRLLLRLFYYANVAGGAFHMVYSQDVPSVYWAVYFHCTYTAVACLLAVGLIAIRLPLPWIVPAALASWEGGWHWWELANFTDDEVYRPAFRAMTAYLPVCVTLAAWAADTAMRRLVPRRGRT